MKVNETVKISIIRVENKLLDKWHSNVIEGIISQDEFEQLKHTMLTTTKEIKTELIGE